MKNIKYININFTIIIILSIFYSLFLKILFADEFLSTNKIVANVNNNIIFASDLDKRYKLQKILHHNNISKVQSKLTLLHQEIDYIIYNDLAEKFNININDMELENSISDSANYYGYNRKKLISKLQNEDLYEIYLYNIKSEINKLKLLFLLAQNNIKLKDHDIKNYLDMLGINYLGNKFQLSNVKLTDSIIDKKNLKKIKIINDTYDIKKRRSLIKKYIKNNDFNIIMKDAEIDDINYNIKNNLLYLDEFISDNKSKYKEIYSNIFKIEGDYYIFKLSNKQNTINIEQYKKQIIPIIIDKRIDSEFNNFITKIRDNYDININI